MRIKKTCHDARKQLESGRNKGIYEQDLRQISGSITKRSKRERQQCVYFELRLTSEDNCRIRIIDFDAFDIDGNKYSAGADKISTTDVILGHSKFLPKPKD